jgi:hypothetical protein
MANGMLVTSPFRLQWENIKGIQKCEKKIQKKKVGQFTFLFWNITCLNKELNKLDMLICKTT